MASCKTVALRFCMSIRVTLAQPTMAASSSCGSNRSFRQGHAWKWLGSSWMDVVCCAGGAIGSPTEAPDVAPPLDASNLAFVVPQNHILVASSILSKLFLLAELRLHAPNRPGSAGWVPMQRFGAQVRLSYRTAPQHLPSDYCVSTFPTRGDPTSNFWRGSVSLASLAGGSPTTGDATSV